MSKLFLKVVDDDGLFIREDFFDEIPLATELIIIDGVEVIKNLLDENGNTYFDKHYITTPCPQGFILPKWDGVEWVEGGTPYTLTEEEISLNQKRQLVNQLIDGGQYLLPEKLANMNAVMCDLMDMLL